MAQRTGTEAEAQQQTHTGCFRSVVTSRRWLFSLLPLVFLAGTVAAPVSAQTNSTSGTSAPSSHSHHHRHKKVAATPPPPPPPPPPPLRPAEQPPQPAKVTYTQGQLHVEANNSSLVEILNQISRETGVSIEGANHDQRLYGQYGPGPVVSVLPELLDGAGYDYVVEGGSNGKPGKLVLTPSTGGGTSSGSNPVTSNLSPTPAPQPAMGNANGSGMEDPTQPPNPKTPQQIFEELRRMHPQ